MKHIVVSVINDLITDQRVHKVCSSLTKSGYKVTLIGRLLKNSTAINRDYKTLRMRLIFNKGALFYAEFNIRLFLKLLFLKKDILHANDLDTLLPNFLVSKFFNKKLVYDSHELFTEVPELINRPKTQRIWLSIEKKIVPKLKNCITVCDSIATYYHNKYNTSFHVIKNVPENIEPEKISPPFNKENKKIILYQGALNKGRGLELMIDTMGYLNDCLFVIAGAGDIEDELIKRASKKSNNIQFLGRLTPTELKSITPFADLGISFEEDLGLNYRYALPNKIFDYIQADVPSLVSDLPEMKNIVVGQDFGTTLLDREPKNIAKQITTIFEYKNNYDRWKQNLKNSNNFIWKYEEKKLISIFTNLK